MSAELANTSIEDGFAKGARPLGIIATRPVVPGYEYVADGHYASMANAIDALHP